MFKCKFHQQTKLLWRKFKFSKINMVLRFYPLEIFLSTVISLPNFVTSNYQKVIADIWVIFVSYSFYIGLPFFWSLDLCLPKILDAHLRWSLSLRSNTSKVNKKDTEDTKSICTFCSKLWVKISVRSLTYA